jgi:hypothetical protein
MSAKLENSISKCMLTVSDRVERERIDHNNAEREIEAAERAEEAKIREQWKTNAGKEGGDDGLVPMKVEGSQRIRSVKRITLRRKSDTDFEVPFFDEEDDGQHERSYFEVMKQQKSTFQRQQAELIRMRFSTGKLGQAVFDRMMQRQLALKWVSEEQKKLGITMSPQKKTGGRVSSGPSDEKDKRAFPAPSSVAAKLEKKERDPLKISLSSAIMKKGIGGRQKKTKAQSLSHAMDWECDEE